MKILYLCADPGIPVFGRKGCSTHVRETCLVLERLGHQVRLLCSNDDGDRDGSSLQVDLVEPPRSRKLSFDGRHILLNYRFGRRLDQLVREWQPDAIYERYTLYNTAGSRAARRYDLPRLVELNAFLTREQEGRIRLGSLARFVERRIVRQSPCIIVVSEPLVREISELGFPRERIVKMPMAVDLHRFSPGDGTETRRRLGLEGVFVIGYVGTLSGWHGLELLDQVAARLRQLQAPPFAFVVIGGEGEKLELSRRRVREAGLADHVRFIGSVSHDEIPAHLRALDVGVVPDTTYWSSPAKLFEYQACGIPALAPDYPAIREAMDHGCEGFIFEPLQVERMAQLALEMIRDPQRTAQMGQSARRRAERDHSWEGNAHQIVELFERYGRPPAR